MNLIEALKLAHEGFVRSPSRTGGEYCDYSLWSVKDLEAEDWEPKPAPAKLFECEVWITPTGLTCAFCPGDDEQKIRAKGWRKIRVREVTE